jgi:signal transduction histidine kinase
MAARRPTIRRRRRFGVRLWLALAFAAVGVLTAASVYLFVADTSEQAAEERSDDVAAGRALQLANALGKSPPGKASSTLNSSRSENFTAWTYDPRGKLTSPRNVLGVNVDSVQDLDKALETALAGDRFIVGNDEKGASVIALPILRDNEIDGAVVVRATRPPEVRDALQALRGDRLRALAIAVGVALLIGALVASVITGRVKRLADAAGLIAEGRLDIPLQARGADEIGDLGRSLDAMRIALRDSFDVLASERDRLGAILAGLTEAVIVVSRDGRVRFSNPAATRLISDGRPIEALEPWLRRATQRGTAVHDNFRVGDRLYALQARDLPAEGATLLVVRDRTEELRRDQAEREFVSNAAHELRNPIAGISGAIEVLQSGAKDDPDARDHFLARLAEDAERVSRLTHSLLTLARMEAIGEGEAEVVSVEIAVEDAAEAVVHPEGVDLELEVDPDLGAEADPVLLRQVLIGLLTNAFKNTSAPGVVTLRARRRAEDEVLIEVTDTGAGIPMEERDRVFERFYRGSGSLEQEGFGLGLSIARRMVDVMGGAIGVDSEEGRGSTFWIRLPLAKPSPTPVA